MAVPIQISSSKSQNYVTPSSRYVASDVIVYGEQGILTFETYKRQSTISSQDMFAIIPAGEEYRPDLTSYRAYGTVDFWWRIMEVNKIYDIYDYVSGTNIRIPSPINL